MESTGDSQVLEAQCTRIKLSQLIAGLALTIAATTASAETTSHTSSAIQGNLSPLFYYDEPCWPAYLCLSRPHTKEVSESAVETVTEGTPPTPWFRDLLLAAAFILSVWSFWASQRDKKNATQKSIYDEYWFREVFHKPLISSINDFHEAWSAGASNPKEQERLLKDLRQIEAHIDFTLKGLCPNASKAMIDLLESLEQYASCDPDNAGNAAIHSLYSISMDLHRELISSNFNADRLQGYTPATPHQSRDDK